MFQIFCSCCRHRLVVPKYNPARTFTPEGAVGLGGAYMCIYPMDSPGGYQLIGRTLPIWNTFGRVGPFTPAKPWLLRYFDQVEHRHTLATQEPPLLTCHSNSRLCSGNANDDGAVDALLQVKFELVSEEELEKQRKDFRNGELKLRIDEEEFNMRLASSAAS